MNALEVIQHFIDAFNRHDADAVNALYAEGASYHSPRFDHPVKGQAIADFRRLEPKASQPTFLKRKPRFP
jgi:ketosteroid isomerase-like protein